MNIRLFKIGFAALVALSIPAVAVFAHGAADAANSSKGLTRAAQQAQGTLPSTVGAPDTVGTPTEDEPDVDETTDEDTDEDTTEDTDEDAGQPADAGQRPENHGWFVSQAAKDHSTVGRAHGEAVSTVARSDAGKPSH